jgi:diaminopimelate decarboxylase
MMRPRIQLTTTGSALQTVGHAGGLFGALDGVPIATLNAGGGVFVDDLDRPLSYSFDDLGRSLGRFVDDLGRRL